jgi:hypothetical protein
MNLLPAMPPRKVEPRYSAKLVDSAWFVLDRQSGARMGRARYTVEIQARWTAEAMEEAYRAGLREGEGRDR